MQWHFPQGVLWLQLNPFSTKFKTLIFNISSENLVVCQDNMPVDRGELPFFLPLATVVRCMIVSTFSSPNDLTKTYKIRCWILIC